MQRLNHHHLYLYWVFGRNGSFTKTARELGIAQSAVTTQIRQLEESLSLPLVDRSNPRRPEITPEGRKVLEYADSIFETSRELLHWATKGALPKLRVIRIGALSGLSRNLQCQFMAPLISNPGVRFEVIAGDARNLLSMLAEYELDVVLGSHGVGAEVGRGFRSWVLASSPLVFVVEKSQVRSARPTLEKILKGKSLFIPGRGFEAKPELHAFLEDLSVPFRIAGEIDDIALLRVLALRSGAVVALPELGALREITSGDLKVIARLDRIQQRFYAITRQSLGPNEEVSRLIDRLVKRC